MLRYSAVDLAEIIELPISAGTWLRHYPTKYQKADVPAIKRNDVSPGDIEQPPIRDQYTWLGWSLVIKRQVCKHVYHCLNRLQAMCKKFDSQSRGHAVHWFSLIAE